MAKRTKTRYGMTLEQWDATVERARAFVIACAGERRTTTYSELSDVLAPARVPAYGYSMVALLDEICTGEDAARGITLASLVCTKATGMPGEGYFRCARRLGEIGDPRAFWESERDRAFEGFADRE